VTERWIGGLSAALALVGIGITGYLLYVRGTGATLACATGGCETVQSSRYAEIFGVPVAAFGLVGYAALFSTALAVGDRARLAHAALALGALAFSGYLLVLQGVVIGAFCDWCLAGDLLATGIAALALLRLKVAVPSYLSAAGPPGIADDARADGSKLVAWPPARERDRLPNGASGSVRDARR
jgi:uncharacterized membrane protein